jgi:hypothetical protein
MSQRIYHDQLHAIMKVPNMMKAIMRAAAMNATAQSRTSQPQDFFDELSSNAGAEQHTNDHPIQEVLNLCHALVPIAQRTIYAVVSFKADSFMHGKSSLRLFHLQPLESLVV